MAFIPTPNAARCAIRQTLFEQDVVNTLWFLYPGETPPDQSALQVLADEVKNWWATQLRLALSEDIEIQEVTATGQTTILDPSVTSTGGAIAGSLAGASLPGSNCVTASFRTAGRGRSSRGRNYVAGLREVDVAGNVVDSATITAIVDAYLDLLDNPLEGWSWVVVSHFTNGAPRSEGLAQLVLNATVVDTNVDSQRRRLTGRGS